MKSKLNKDEQFDNIIDLINTTYEMLKDVIENEELDVYLNGDKIDEHKVDFSDDIEPSQVASLGAYTLMAVLKKSVDSIQKGNKAVKVTNERKSKKGTVKEARVVGIKVAGGKASVVREGELSGLPPAVRKALMKLMKEIEES